MTNKLVHIYKNLLSVPVSPALKALRGLFLFLAMVAIPIAANALFQRGPSHWLKDAGPGWALVAIAAAAASVLALIKRRQDEADGRFNYIAGCLSRAERDMNALLLSGMEHGGRRGKAKERAEWHQMVQPAGIQIFNSGYRTPAHDLIDLNEKDIAGKGAVMGKVAATALLFRELYEGGVGAAQSRVVAELKNGNTGLYVAPGIRELIGFNDAVKEKGKFEEGAGVNGGDLQWVATHRKFPSKNLVMVKTNAAGERKELRGYEVLIELTQQKL